MLGLDHPNTKEVERGAKQVVGGRAEQHDALSEGDPCVAASSSDVCAQWRLHPCGHTYCNGASCLSAQAVECPECRQAVEGRVGLFGALANVKALATGGSIADWGVIQSRRGGERGRSICAVGGGGEEGESDRNGMIMGKEECVVPSKRRSTLKAPRPRKRKRTDVR